MTSDDAKPGVPRPISRWAFWGIFLASFFVLVCAESLSMRALNRAFGVHLDIPGSWAGLFVFSNMILAWVVVDSTLKRFGRSLSGQTLEVRQRTALSAEGEVENGEAVEFRDDPSIPRGQGTACLLFCGAIALALIFIPQEKMKEIDSAYVLMAFLGTAAGVCFHLARWGKPQTRANSSGIWALPVGHLRARIVPWSEVATCEIETHYDPFGKPIVIRPTLKGTDGKILGFVNMAGTRVEDQERLVKFIKARLPKTQVDPWEF